MKVVLDARAYAPERAHEHDAGLDLRIPVDMVIRAHGSITVDTGVHVQIPNGCYGKLESKSGLNVKHGVVSCGGVIDAGYTGSIVVKLYNLSNEPYTFKAGDKIVQLIVVPYYAPRLELVSSLEDTERGANGFGSSGR